MARIERLPPPMVQFDNHVFAFIFVQISGFKIDFVRSKVFFRIIAR